MKVGSRLNLAQGDSNMIPQASSQPIQKNGNNQIKQRYCWLQLHKGIQTRFVKNTLEPANLLFLIGSDLKRIDGTVISCVKLGLSISGVKAMLKIEYSKITLLTL